VADQRQQVVGLHPARSVLERRAADVRQAYVLDRPDGKLAELAHLAESKGIELHRMNRHELDRLAGGAAHQGIVLDVRPTRAFELTDLERLVENRGRGLRLLVLDQVEDPRNLGACLRTADAAGVDAVVVPRSRSAGLTSAAVKAAAGAAETVPLAVVPNLARLLAWIRQAGVWVVGADADAPADLYAARLEPPIAIVLGAEGKGLRRLTREHCDELVSIPMQGTVASLNVSVAAGVVLYELLRQAKQAPEGD
jgi:23S rRNA (guanosine2251-2'-O)-methyltransferase